MVKLTNETLGDIFDRHKLGCSCSLRSLSIGALVQLRQSLVVIFFVAWEIVVAAAAVSFITRHEV